MKLDDLKARLQLIAAWHKPGGPTPKEEMPNRTKTCLEAATAITDLEAQVERLSGDGIHTCPDQCTRVACVLRREKADLEALVGELGEALAAWRRDEVQAIGAAISTRNWHSLEKAYSSLRDKMDRRATLAKLEKARG